jgi:hypothetical protein
MQGVERRDVSPGRREQFGVFGVGEGERGAGRDSDDSGATSGSDRFADRALRAPLARRERCGGACDAFDGVQVEGLLNQVGECVYGGDRLGCAFGDGYQAEMA